MADIADVAQEQIDIATSSALSKTPVYTGKSSLYCHSCGEPIPEERRDAVPGCSFCIYCQNEREVKSKHGI